MKIEPSSIFDVENEKSKRIVDIDQAPSWIIDNKYLLTGYRVNFNSMTSNLRSMFIRHNELMNIWTHFIGAMIFIALIIYTSNSFPRQNWKINEFQTSFVSAIQDSDFWVQNYKTNVLPKLDAFIIKKNKLNFNKEQITSSSKDILSSISKEVTVIKQKYLKLFEIDNVLRFEAFEKKYLELTSQMNDLLDYINENGQLSDDKISEVPDQIINKFNLLIGLVKNTFDELILHQKSLKSLTQTLTSKLEIYPIVIFSLTAFFCLMSSCIFHLFYPISKSVYKILHKMDLAGIAILNFGSSFAMFYYYFYCMTTFNRIYSISIFIACFTVFFVSLTEKIHLERNVKWKSLMYAALGLSNILPTSHLIFLSLKSSDDNDFIPLNICIFLLVLMAALYLVGLAIYTLRFPERFFPKTFDIWMNSHTIWHLFVFLAAFTHFLNVVILYQSRANKTCMKIY
jgi:adiponectin receptor